MMKKWILKFAAVLLLSGSFAFGQTGGGGTGTGGGGVRVTGTPAANDCAKFVNSNTITTAGAACGTGTGGVTSVGLTVNSTSPSGIFTVTGSPVTTSGTLNFNLAGTSGGIPYFSSTTALSSSGALTANGVVLGGGAGSTPTVTSADSTTSHALFATAGAPAFRAITSTDIPSGTITWDKIGNPVAGLSLTMGSNTSIFNTTTALSQMFAWKNTTAAVVGTSQGSPILSDCGTAFHGSASVEDCLTLSELPGNGNDAAIAFAIGHTGTSTGTVTLTTPILAIPTGSSTAPAIKFLGDLTTGISQGDGTGFVDIINSGARIHAFGTTKYALVSDSANIQFGGGSDVNMSRGAAGLLDIGTGTALNTGGLVLSGNKVLLTSDFTDSNSSGLQAITGLSFALPNVAKNWSFHCSLAYSEATPIASDQFGVASLTTAPTNLKAQAHVITTEGAAAVQTTGNSGNIASTTPTSIVTFTPVGAGEKPVEIDGSIEVAGTGASTLQFYVTNGTAADVIVVKRDSYCEVR